MKLKQITTLFKNPIIISLFVFLLAPACSVYVGNVPPYTAPIVSDELTEAEKNIRPNGYHMAYITILELDICGHAELGKKLRNALFEKVNSCGFSENEKKEFYKDIATDVIGEMSSIIEYVRAHSELPDNVISRKSCKDFIKHDFKLKELEKTLDKYERKEITLNDLTPSVVPSCRQGASSAAEDLGISTDTKSK